MKRVIFILLTVPALAWADIDVTVDHGAVWQTVKAGGSTEGFIEVHNSGQTGDTLLATSCPIADQTELLDGRGKPLQSLAIPPGQTVVLDASGPHLLLRDTHFNVAYGSVLPCSFTFQSAGQIGGYLNAVPAPQK